MTPLLPRPLLRPAPLIILALVCVVVLGLLVDGSANAVTRWDADVVSWVVDRRTPVLVDVARVITNFGNGMVVAVVLVVVGGFCVVQGLLRPWTAATPVIALALGAALSAVGKTIVGRSRPPQAFHEVVETTSGFPSGHSTQSAAGWIALALVLVYFRVDCRPSTHRWVLAAAAVVVGLVGLSRVVLGVHSPTDVVAGWVLGAACSLAAVGVLARTGYARGAEGEPAGDDVVKHGTVAPNPDTAGRER